MDCAAWSRRASGQTLGDLLPRLSGRLQGTYHRRCGPPELEPRRRNSAVRSPTGDLFDIVQKAIRGKDQGMGPG